MSHTKVAKSIKRNEAGHVLYVTGLLFEINRTVLHPVGMSLVWNEEDGVNILDFSNMPEKAVFDPVDYNRGSAKFKNFLREKGNAAMKIRRSILGFVTQSEANIGK